MPTAKKNCDQSGSVSFCSKARNFASLVCRAFTCLRNSLIFTPSLGISAFRSFSFKKATIRRQREHFARLRNLPRVQRCNYLVVASNTLDTEHKHRASFFHRGQQAYIESLNVEDLPRGHARYVTASITINNVRLRIALPCHEIVYRIVGHRWPDDGSLCLAVTPHGSSNTETTSLRSLGSIIRPTSSRTTHSEKNDFQNRNYQYAER